MEGSDKGFSTASPKPSYAGLGENNENDLSQEQMIPMLQNHKKTVTKHFMSLTISAASKVAAPRKKILLERDENSSSSDGTIHKTSNHVAKERSKNSSISHSDGSSSQAISSYKGASESDNDEDTNVVADSSLKVYEPLTNYFSTRPKFFHFNPKRREILNRLEKEDGEDLNGSFDSKKVSGEEESSAEDVKDSSLSPKQESVVKQENTENEDENTDDDKDEDEEETEERGWCFRGVLKFLLILIAYFLSTSYICSMNSRSPSTTQQAIQGLKVGYLMVQKQTIEAITMKMHSAGFLAVEEGDINVDKVKTDEDDKGENVEAEMVEDAEVNLDKLNEELVGNDNDNNAIDEAAETEGGGEVESIVERFEQLIGDTNAAESGDAGGCELEKAVEGSNEDHLDKIDETAETEVVGGEVESKTESFEPLIGARTDGSEDAGGYGLEKEVGDFNQLEELETSVDSNFKTVDGEELLEINGSHEKSTDSVHEVEVETKKDGWNTAAVIGVPAVSIILASLLFVNRLKKAGNIYAQETPPMLKPCKSAVEKKVTTLLPATQKKIEFFARPSLSISMEEASEELNYHIHAPTVELIGEIVVGEMNSSFRSYGRKNQVIESEEINATFSQKQGSVFQPVTASNQPSVPNFSTTNSPLYGSFTDESKILKEGGKDGEPKVEATPVRRSSRIRSRAAVMSP